MFLFVFHYLLLLLYERVGDIDDDREVESECEGDCNPIRLFTIPITYAQYLDSPSFLNTLCLRACTLASLQYRSARRIDLPALLAIEYKAAVGISSLSVFLTSIVYDKFISRFTPG